MKKTAFVILAVLLSTASGQMTWTCANESALRPPRSGHTSLVRNDTMWVMGGTYWNGSEFEYLNDVWYSTDGDSWTCATDSASWSPRSGHTSLVFDDKMWVIGGCHTFYPYLCLNDVWWSADGANWTAASAAAPWLPRRLHTSLVFDDTMWVMGGFTDGNVLTNDVWKSADGDSWVCATNTTWPTRAGHTAVVLRDTMWVMGGYRTGVRRDVWYSTDGSNWTSVTSAAGWSGRLGHSSVAFDDKLWVMAGSNLSSFYNDVWYSTDGDSWTCATDSAPWAGRTSASSWVYDNRIWIMGGSPDVASFLGDVWHSTGLGIEETPNAELRTTNVATVVRGVLLLPTNGDWRTAGGELLDATGRRVVSLLPGANDVRHLVPGVYFVRAVSRELSAVGCQKVILTR